MPPPSLKSHNGSPTPFGATPSASGTNFAIYARESKDVTLVLQPPKASTPLTFTLSPAANRTGLVWHVEIRPPVPNSRYLWRVGQRDSRWCTNECLDPWARLTVTPTGATSFNAHKHDYSPWALVPSSPAPVFDWQDVSRPKHAWKDLIIYEIHTRGFTHRSNEKSGKHQGFLGIIERIPYLKALGINCVELLPVMEFNETEWQLKNPNTKLPLCQYWGYSTVSFFSPMNRYGRDGAMPEQVVADFKLLVRELHRANIEIILDVVFNHTAEMGYDFVGRGFYGMKQLAPQSYYLLDSDMQFRNFSGCGNTINGNHPITQEFICECVKYWAHEMGVDGFRFDLASALCRGTDGTAIKTPPVIERMTKDASLRDTKLIAEPWDCGNLYQVGTFPHFGAWAEWNGKFRDCIRRFIRGDSGMIGEFATRMSGSADMYDREGRKPYHSINFVTSHDGFSMRDLVTYCTKRNDENGEGNRDGDDQNHSWNCGKDGTDVSEDISQLRNRQIRNFLVALFIGVGTPMLAMGDEYGHSQNGNNNAWCQDSNTSWFDWNLAYDERDKLLRFTQRLIGFRRQHEGLRRANFLDAKDVTWHGIRAGQPQWNNEYNLLAFVRKKAGMNGGDIYVAFNAGKEGREVELPAASGNEGWRRMVDTQLPHDRQFCTRHNEKMLRVGSLYGMKQFSCVILISSDVALDEDYADEVEAAFEPKDLVELNG